MDNGTIGHLLHSPRSVYGLRTRHRLLGCRVVSLLPQRLSRQATSSSNRRHWSGRQGMQIARALDSPPDLRRNLSSTV